MNQELKEILLKNINNYDIIFSMDTYLKQYKQPLSKFNDMEYDNLKFYLMYQYHKCKNLSSLFTEPYVIEILNRIPTNLSQADFVNEINKLTKYNYNSSIDLCESVNRRFKNKVLKVSGWLKLYSNNVIGSPISETTHRIYVAIDNAYLHKFSFLLVKYCELYNISYQFKINNVDEGNQYDNVVIYSNENELPKYIYVITEILNRISNIKVNKPCLIGYPYDNNIVVAPYIDTEFESYSSIVSKNIAYYRDYSEDRKDFFRNVENYLNDTLFSTKQLCEKIKQDRLSVDEIKRTR